jgi:hypothetical protein
LIHRKITFLITSIPPFLLEFHQEERGASWNPRLPKGFPRALLRSGPGNRREQIPKYKYFEPTFSLGTTSREKGRELLKAISRTF